MHVLVWIGLHHPEAHEEGGARRQRPDMTWTPHRDGVPGSKPQRGCTRPVARALRSDPVQFAQQDFAL